METFSDDLPLGPTLGALARIVDRCAPPEDMMRHLFLLSTLSLATLVGVSGCSSEEYYCDESGCYFCDGLGCREVDPPDRPMCRGDFECPEGSICTDLGCVDECAGDADCPDGTVCRSGMCVGPTEPDPDPNPGVCERNADCDAGLVCRDGICTPDDVSCGETGCSCEATGMCSDGFTCLDGECREDEDLCRFNTECGGDGRICLDGRCTTGCETSAECVGGQICIDNFCQDDTAPVPECVRNETCETGEVCEDGRCVAECDRDRDCGDGLYCRSGRCAVDDRPRPFCEVDADCRFACVNGVCRTPCETSRMCAEVDVQFSVCFEDYCATANEATSDCSISADCASGRECIDGICR